MQSTATLQQVIKRALCSVSCLILLAINPLTAQPILVAPDSGATFLDVDHVQLVWRSVPEATSYELTVKERGGGYLLLWFPLTDTSLALSNLNESRRYVWHVDDFVGETPGQRSSDWLFSTEYGPPGTPKLMSPADSSEIGVDGASNTAHVAFWWTPHGDSETVRTQILTDSLFAFRIQVSSEPTFTSGLTVDSTRTCLPHNPGFSCWDDNAAIGQDGFLVYQRYYWRIQQKNRAGSGNWSETWSFVPVHVVDLESYDELDGPITLLQNHPNPFHDQTLITFSTTKSVDVSIHIYDSIGRLVTTLFEGLVGPGFQSILWDAETAPSGVYICRLASAGGVSSHSILLLR